MFSQHKVSVTAAGASNFASICNRSSGGLAVWSSSLSIVPLKACTKHYSCQLLMKAVQQCLH